MNQTFEVLSEWLAGLIVLVLLVTAGVCSCTPGERKAARTVVDIADATCVLIHAKDARGITIEDVCATEEELSPLVHTILGARRMAAEARAAAASSAASGSVPYRSAPSGGSR